MDKKIIIFNHVEKSKEPIYNRRNKVNRISISNTLPTQTSKRNIKNIYLILRIKYKNKIAGILVDKESDFILYRRENIEEAFNRFTTKNNINIYKNKELNFYIIRNGKSILIDNKQEIHKIHFEHDDVIQVVTTEKDLEENNDVIYNIKNQNNIKKNKIIPISIIIILILCIFIILFVLLYFFIFKKKKEIIFEEKSYFKEKLVANLSYNLDILYRYQSVKKIDLIVDGDDMQSDNSIQTVKQYIDFAFIIRNKYYEIKNNATKKYWFTGYIGILNITINNGSDDTIILYDKNLNQLLNEVDKNQQKFNNNLRHLNESNNTIDDENEEYEYLERNNTSSFIKINFYENGEIIDIFLPDKFLSSNMIFIENIIKLIIPKLSPNLFIKNITSKLNELKSQTVEESDFIDIEEEEDYSDSIFDSDNEEIEFGKNSIENIRRRMKENEYINNIDIEGKTDYYNEDIVIEEYIDSRNDSSESIFIDLREVNNFTNNNTFDSNNDTNTSKNYINLTHYSNQPLESDEISFKDSELNTIIYSNIDEKGILYFIEEIQTTVLNQPDKEKNEEEEKRREDELRKEVYNSNNQISMEDIDNDININNNLTFNISKFTMESINNISLVSKYDNEKLKREIYNYFDKFEYFLHKGINTTNKNRRLFDINDTRDEKTQEYEKSLLEYKDNLRKKRKLENSDGFYKLKTFNYSKPLFNYCLLGLRLEGSVVCEIEVSTGVVSNYFNFLYAKKNIKFNLAYQQTNLHIIIENINKMSYDFICLLYKSNYELTNNNTKYADVIINIEKNVSNLFEKYFDYSGIFTESLNNLYFQISNFTMQFLEDLLKLIDEVHSNYSLILSKGQNDSYEFINEIRNITKNSYIEYVHNMIQNLEIFNNKTLFFLDRIEEETMKIEIFQIDLLYDIIDLIYDTKLIFRNFNNNLFKAIEKGIITFKYDLLDYIENIIGELLYITDFLSINLNKNEIFIKP